MDTKSFEVDTLRMLGDLVWGREPTPIENVQAIEDVISNGPHFKGKEFPVKDYVKGGVYVRELFIPKGILATGVVHTKDHIFVSDGDVTLYDGEDVQRQKGKIPFPCRAGTKRAAYAHEDSIVTTLHPQKNCTALEDELDIAMNKRGIT